MAAVQYLYPETSERSDNQALVSQAMSLSKYMCSEWAMQFRPGIARGILRYLAQGFDPALIRAVIDVTSRAPRPSWAYLEAIMRRAEREHSYTLVDFDLYGRSRHQVTAQQYQQREYTEAELLAVSDDLFEEARRLRDQENQKK